MGFASPLTMFLTRKNRHYTCELSVNELRYICAVAARLCWSNIILFVIRPSANWNRLKLLARFHASGIKSPHFNSVLSGFRRHRPGAHMPINELGKDTLGRICQFDHNSTLAERVRRPSPSDWASPFDLSDAGINWFLIPSQGSALPLWHNGEITRNPADSNFRMVAGREFVKAMDCNWDEIRRCGRGLQQRDMFRIMGFELRSSEQPGTSAKGHCHH